ncbi:YafY family protein [Terrarubrum flagellatum]|uniref:helix-turn-helix transcriptional regulator n=1 Tax=Terrirubrum flagellatum TaxID=2895980 RepID=UPI00314531EE
MRRADRLFEIVQFLRRRKVARASDIARALKVSERTVYRDIRDMIARGVPIDGEAGVGYLLRPGFDLPPLMFNEQQIEALVLGARIVQSWADPELAAAAADVIAKVRDVLPDARRHHVDSLTLWAPDRHHQEPITIDQAALRAAMREQRKIEICYRDLEERESRRKVRPLIMAFYGPVWLLTGWCEVRHGFRVFRLDRITEMMVLEERFESEPGKTAQDFLEQDRRE